MTGLIRRNIVLLLAFGLLLFSVYLTRLSVRYPEMPRKFSDVVSHAWSPVESVVIRLRRSLSYYWSHYLWLVGAEEELERVSAEKRQLDREMLRLLQLEDENLKLRDVLQFRSATGFNGVIASVIGFDPSNWSRTIKIDKGSNSHIAVGYAVVDGPGLVGQVIQVADDWSRVLLIDDKASAVGVLLERVHIPAIVEGNLGRRLRLSYVEQSVDVVVGDRVLTSGLDGVYPRGLLVGSVLKSAKEPGRIFQDIVVQPTTDAVRARFVQVIIPGLSVAPPEEAARVIISNGGIISPKADRKEGR